MESMSRDPIMTLQEAFRPGQGVRKMMKLRVFEDRVECTQPGLVGHGATTSVRYEQIAQVVVERGLRWSRLAVETTGGGGFQIAGLAKDDAEAAKSFINERLHLARSHSVSQPVVTSSMAEQIAQLAGLRDSGALTDEEFVTAKARLLDPNG
jgi:hypothetical protein